MAEDANEQILVPGPEGDLYLVPLSELAAYRLSHDEASDLAREIEDNEPEVSGFAQTFMRPTTGNAGGRRGMPQPGVGGYQYQAVVANTRGGLLTIQVPISGLGLV